MCVEAFLPLTDGLLIKSWGHTDNGVTLTDVMCCFHNRNAELDVYLLSEVLEKEKKP